MFSRRFKFSYWPNLKVPRVAAGVYAIWHGANLFYCGMAGKGLDGAVKARKTTCGIYKRLAHHASGRLSGDQFCVYIANRLVVPKLDITQLPRFEKGELTLDALTKRFIHEHLEYQFRCVLSNAAAVALERECRQGKVFGAKPFLNPQ